VHLRTNIKLVKNRFFSKRECENMVHQVLTPSISKPLAHNLATQLNLETLTIRRTTT
jgi:hypothetical protein